MQFISSSQTPGRITRKVLLTTEEAQFSDADLITVADNSGRHGKPARHFGGNVKKAKGLKTDRIYALIDIYTD